MTDNGGDAFQENSSSSLTEAVEDLSHRSYNQSEALKEKKKTLNSLQAVLSDILQENETAEQELKCKSRELLILEGEVENAELHIKVLHRRCDSITKDSAQLRLSISEQQEDARRSSEQFKAYRDKMERHRAATCSAFSHTGAHKELEEKKELLRMLRKEKDELRADLESPNGKTVQLEKQAVEALRKQISEKRSIIAEKQEQLQKEGEVHNRIRKDIEIQNRRFEAIVKRLRCQQIRARAAHRQVCDDIYHMRRQLAELQSQRDSAGDGLFHL